VTYRVRKWLSERVFRCSSQTRFAGDDYQCECPRFHVQKHRSGWGVEWFLPADAYRRDAL